MTTHPNRGGGPRPSPRVSSDGDMRRRNSRPRLAAAFACLALAPILGRPLAASAAPAVAPRQTVVGLLAEHPVRSRPAADGTLVGSVAALRPITQERTVLPVLAESTDAQGRHWLRVRLPGRTIGRKAPPPTGWIRGTHAQLTSTAWHLVVDVGGRGLLVYRSGRLLRSFRAIVGKRSTPTPTGRYFVEENVRLLGAAPGAPFALATSARSSVLQEFDGGPGQIAIHGVANLGSGSLGTAISHGCVRVAGSAVTWLAHRIGPGVPITIQ